MFILVVGVDHTTAPIVLRERLACGPHQVPHLLKVARQFAPECALLSTCNRVEMYAVCADLELARTRLLEVFSETRHVELDELLAHCYSFSGSEAIAHLFSVASGLCSLVPGETQIQGQVAGALELAQASGASGPIISALFRAALATGKRARSETSISRNAASVSQMAVQLARKLIVNLNEARVLLVGSGKMSELAAKNLTGNGVQSLVVINRTTAHAVELAQRVGAVHRSFYELAEALIQADVVISSTTAPRAIITLELMQRVLEQREPRPLLLIDIAVPRDVDAAVAFLPGVHLYNIDDLQEAVNEGIRLRLQEVEPVQAIIAQEMSAFEQWLRSLSVVATIRDLRQHVEALRQHELERAMRQLAPELSERESLIVQELTTRLMNKLLHKPTRRLKDAAANGQGYPYVEALRYLFDLEEREHEA